MEVCKHCNGTGNRISFITEQTDLFRICPRCSALGEDGEYGNGVALTRHIKCNGKGCPECSSVEQHGKAGYLLDKYRTGPNGESIIWERPCATCKGSGKIFVKTVTIPPRKITYPCLRCIDGDSLEKVFENLELAQACVPSNVKLGFVRTQQKINTIEEVNVYNEEY